jgi:hypothetical protein
MKLPLMHAFSWVGSDSTQGTSGMRRAKSLFFFRASSRLPVRIGLATLEGVGIVPATVVEISVGITGAG